MNPASWDRAKHAFHAALEAEPERRLDTVAAVCGDDREARTEAVRMLEHAPAQQEPQATEQQTRAPRTIGRFQLLKLIGSGSTGKVYSARDPRTNETVAVKVLRLNADRESTRRRIEYEGRVLAALDHPCIAQIHETGTASTELGPLPYVAMRLVVGEPIDTHASLRNLSDRQRVELFMHVCDAVAHAHSRGVIHRDLKPANIIVNQAGTPVLLDFGIAGYAANLLDIDTLATRTGDVLGTPGYMSPEQRAGSSQTTDTRSDVYSLGVILYELLARRPVFDIAGMPLVAALEAIDNTHPPLLGTIRPTCRGALEAIVTKAMHHNPRARYSSATAFAEDLQRVLNGHMPLAPPVTAVHKLRRFVRHHRGVLFISSALVLALLITLAAQSRASARALADHQRESDIARTAAERDRAARQLQLAQKQLTVDFFSTALTAITAESAGQAARAFDHTQQLREQVALDPHITLYLYDALGGSLIRFSETRPQAARAYGVALDTTIELIGRQDQRTIRAMQVYAEACTMSDQPELIQQAFDLLTAELALWQFLPDTLSPNADRAQNQRLLRIAMTRGEALARLGRPDEALRELHAIEHSQARFFEHTDPDHSDLRNTRALIRDINDRLGPLRGRRPG